MSGIRIQHHLEQFVEATLLAEREERVRKAERERKMAEAASRKERAPQPPIYLLPKRHWLIRVMAYPYLTALWKRWLRPNYWLHQAIRGWHLLRAVFGPEVSQEEYDDRMAECMSCEHRYVLPVYREGKAEALHFCSLCNCGEHGFAELHSKNWLERWKCPDRRHAGEYSDDWWHAIVPKVARDKMQGKDKARSCNGCGGGCGRR